MNLSAFIIEAKLIHQNKYDYSKVSFIKMSDMIIIGCPEHGDFIQRVSVHINDKCGCKLCGIKNKKTNKKSQEQFIKEANTIHGNYDYSLIKYINSHTPVDIICKKHGIFSQKPYVHVAKIPQGCPKCGIENRKLPNQKTTEKFIIQAKEKWGEKYTYNLTTYKNKYTKIAYECKEHGIIKQKPNLHLKNGCNFCSGRGISKHSKESFVNIANLIHNNKYNYSKTDVISMSREGIITCLKHGDFVQRLGNHIHLKNGCPKCINPFSIAEKEVLKFIKDNYDDEIIENDRDILDGKEIDIYLPEIRLGIEYHGIYYHLETVHGKNYHYNKWKLASKKNVLLLQVYDLEWRNKREIIQSKLMNVFKKSQKIFARKTKIVILNKHDKNKFLDSNHIQGSDNAKICYGLIYNDDIVSCMTFDGSRFNKSYKFELIRFCNKGFCTVVGGASKLLSHFKKNYNGSIISYANNRFSNGNLYKQLGFEFKGYTKPSFSYFNIKNNTLHSRLSFQKHKIKDMLHYSSEITEYEIMKLNGYDRIWDAGNSVWILK